MSLRDKIQMLEEKLQAAEADVEQLRVQMAGVSVAANGGIHVPLLSQDAYGWSVAYQDVFELRLKYNAAEADAKTARDVIKMVDSSELVSTISYSHPFPNMWTRKKDWISKPDLIDWVEATRKQAEGA